MAAALTTGLQHTVRASAVAAVAWARRRAAVLARLQCAPAPGAAVSALGRPCHRDVTMPGGPSAPPPPPRPETAAAAAVSPQAAAAVARHAVSPAASAVPAAALPAAAVPAVADPASAAGGRMRSRGCMVCRFGLTCRNAHAPERCARVHPGQLCAHGVDVGAGQLCDELRRLHSLSRRPDRSAGCAPCRYGVECSRPSCSFLHPGQRCRHGNDVFVGQAAACAAANVHSL